MPLFDSPDDRSGPVVIRETRLERLLGTGQATPRFLQGIYPFMGRGLFEPEPLHPELTYVVPEGTHAEVLYFRAGNHASDLIYLTLLINGKPGRYFPIGPQGDIHVPLAIIEQHPAGTRLEVGYAAAHGLTDAVIVDLGLVEVRESGERTR